MYMVSMKEDMPSGSVIALCNDMKSCADRVLLAFLRTIAYYRMETVIPIRGRT